VYNATFINISIMSWR